MNKFTRFFISGAVVLGVASAAPISILSTYADDSYYQYFTAKSDELKQQIQSSLAKATTMLIDYNTAFSGNISMCSFGVDNSYEIYLPCPNLTISTSSIGGSNALSSGYLPYIHHRLSDDEYFIYTGRYYFSYSASGLYLNTGAYYSYSNGRLDWLCLPTGYYDSSGVLHANSSVNTPYLDSGIFQKQLVSSGSFSSNSLAVQDFIYTPKPIYTFPYDPTEVVSGVPRILYDGGSDVVNIDFPDINIDFDMPDYTFPTTPVMDENIVNGATGLTSSWWDFLKSIGFDKFIFLGLFISLIAFILRK